MMLFDWPMHNHTVGRARIAARSSAAHCGWGGGIIPLGLIWVSTSIVILLVGWISISTLTCGRLHAEQVLLKDFVGGEQFRPALEPDMSLIDHI
jgi:hypothetical protein